MERGQDIQFWETRKRAGRSKPWESRWRVDTTPKSKSFLTKELARNYEAALRKAARDGLRFSVVTGEPVAWETTAETFYAHAVAYARRAWAATDSGNTRRLVADNLMRLVLASVDDRAAAKHPAPAPLARVRSALVHYALSFAVDPAGRTATERVAVRDCPDTETAACLAWVASVSRPVTDFAGLDAVRDLLDVACVRLLGSGPSAAATVRRRRGILLAVLDHAVERGILAANPLAGVRLRRARTSDAVNPRTVPDQAQARRLVTSVTESNNPTDRFLSAFFALSYLAGTRPGETRAVVKGDITWPEDITAADAVPGWGLLTAAGSRTEVGASYTDSGTAGETRELKHRAFGDVRVIPLPPEAVKVLRWHIATYGTAPDGRLFWHPTKDDPYDTLPGKVYRRTWARARKAVLTDAETAAGLAARPYDLRHGYASHAFNLGLSPTMIAKRLGHSVEMLLTVYTHWSDNNDAEANRLLGASLERGGPITGQLLENTPEKPQNPRSKN